MGSTGDILEVYRELAYVGGQIEEMEGRLRYLANQADMSTLTIDLIPDVLSKPVSIAGWEPQGVAKEALQALVVALQGLVNVVIWLVILVVPLLLILLIPVAFVIWLIRRWWKGYAARRKAAAHHVPAFRQERDEMAAVVDQLGPAPPLRNGRSGRPHLVCQQSFARGKFKPGVAHQRHGQYVTL